MTKKKNPQKIPPEKLPKVPPIPKPINIQEVKKAHEGPILLNGMGPSESIFEKVKTRPIRLLIRQHQSPGDILMLTAAIRDLHKAYPGLFLTDIETATDALFENNPYITRIPWNDPELFIIQAEYPLVHESNQGPFHFVVAFHDDLERKLGIPVRPTKMRGDIHISDEEKGWFSQIHDTVGKDLPYWIIDAGCKSDYTCKLWEVERFQQVVNAFPQITWVQIGAKDAGHMHKELAGENVINLVGKTDMRQFVRLMYHACGVITPVSFPMHLAAAVEMKSVYKRKNRPCIVLAGGREPNQWEAYANHQFLHTCGQYSCCDDGGCWLSRIERIEDGEEHHNEKICLFPVKSDSGQVIPKCMAAIKAEEVIMHVQRYMEEWNFYKDWK